MHRLGHTRSVALPDHALHTPDAFVRAAWPGFTNAACVVHLSPAFRAPFTLYTAELGPGGSFAPAPKDATRFVYVKSGHLVLDVGGAHPLGPDCYAVVPPNVEHALTSETGAHVYVIEKPFVGDIRRAFPVVMTGDAGEVAPTPLLGDEDIEVRALLPGDPRLDFAVNTMTFVPGAHLPQVEMHVMQHGLVMLDGGGIYRLGDRWHSVTEGDVIQMSPYCPQWFGALGKTPARYLIYKDWNRHPLE